MQCGTTASDRRRDGRVPGAVLQVDVRRAAYPSRGDVGPGSRVWRDHGGNRWCAKGSRRARRARKERGRAGHLLLSQRTASGVRADRVREEREGQPESGGSKRDGRGRPGNQAATGEVTIMSKKAFDSIMAGLQDALAYAKGDKARGRATTFDARDLDVGKVRGKVGLSQD